MCPEGAHIIAQSCEVNPRTRKCKTGGGGCFPGSAHVQLPSGDRKQMQDLRVGELVLTGSGHFLPILGWLDYNPRITTNFTRIHTNQSSSLSLTGSHVIFTDPGKEESYETKFTRDLEVGDILVHEASGNKAEIIKIQNELITGFYAPLTASGTLVVNGFLVSCYASYSHYVSHAALFPARTWPDVFLSNTMGQEGTPAFVTMVKRMGDLLNFRDTS